MNLDDSIPPPDHEPEGDGERTTGAPRIAQLYQRGRWLVIEPEGELDIMSVPLLRRAIEGGAGGVVFDMTRVNFIDASFLGLLAHALNDQVRGHCTVRVARPSPITRRLLGFTSLDHVVAVFGSLDDAVADEGASPTASCPDLGLRP